MTDQQAQPPENTPRRSRSPMQLVGERQLPDQPTLSHLIASATTTATTAPNPPAEYVHRAAWKAGVLGSLNVLAVVLAVRIILLVAVIGALILAWAALHTPETVPYPALIMLVVYGLLVVVPVVWLSSRR